MRRLEKLARKICEALDPDGPDCPVVELGGECRNWVNWEFYVPHAKAALKVKTAA